MLSAWVEAPRKAHRSVITNSSICIQKNWQREKEREIFFSIRTGTESGFLQLVPGGQLLDLSGGHFPLLVIYRGSHLF